MDIETLREYCLSLPHSTEDMPFDEHTLVFRICGKLFALLPLKSADRINLKCDPKEALELREKYPEILPGYHMNKKHWNTVLLNGALSEDLIQEMILKSYLLVYDSLTRKMKENLNKKGQK